MDGPSLSNGRRAPRPANRQILEIHGICTTHSGRALAAVSRFGCVLVTANGKPKALMIPTSEETCSSDLEALDRVTLTRALEAIRTDAVVNGTDAPTMWQLDAEVVSVHAARRRRS